MNFSERLLAEHLPDKILGQQECNLPIPVPISESKYFGVENVPASANGPASIVSTKSGPINTQEVTPAVETNSDIHRLERIETGPDVSTIPSDEASIPSSKPSKKKSRFGAKGIVICAMLSLATGIAVVAAWSQTHSLTVNFKSYNFRGVLDTIFADSSKGQPAAQPAPAAPHVTSPDFSEIQNQLNAIVLSLSSMQQNINELAAGQEQIRKAQWQAAVLQARLFALQTVANAKENKQSAHAATRGSR